MLGDEKLELLLSATVMPQSDKLPSTVIADAKAADMATPSPRVVAKMRGFNALLSS